MAQANYRTETSILHSVATDPECRWPMTAHALERMRERDITFPDVQNVLMFGHVELIERKQEDVWRVRGKDLDDRTLTVACVVYEARIKIKVVTTF